MQKQHPAVITLPDAYCDLSEGPSSARSSSSYLLTPQSLAGRPSQSPSPLSSPPVSDQAVRIGSIYKGERCHVPSSTPQYLTPSVLQSPYRRASIAVMPTYQPSFAFPAPSRSASISHPCTIAEQETLASWQRDFDKIDPVTKDRWARALFADFQAGRIPVTGRALTEYIDWETCIAKVSGHRDAEATARMLVAAQERKAELQPSRLRHKEPPRRQNKFICYRSLRSTQLAAFFTNFKQSQFSAITSLEWKEIDTDWWGEVANFVEDVRRAKYIGQLDWKGNPFQRDTVDSQGSDYSGSSTRVPRKVKSSRQIGAINRFDPYIRRTMAPPSMSRTVSFGGLSPPTEPAVQYRHSIDMGARASPLCYPAAPLQALPDTPALGLYQTPMPGAYPSLSTIPQSPITITHTQPTMMPTSTLRPANDAVPGYIPANATPADITPVCSATSASGKPSAMPQRHLSPLYSPYQQIHAHPHPQAYVPHMYIAHGRGSTNELMERYTIAQDFKANESVPAQCNPSTGAGEWASWQLGLGYAH